MNKDVLIQVESVSKKFCRTLKRSLWYGVQDVANELLGHKGNRDNLRRNEFWSLDNISFELKRGECLGLIGPNGAGKSTLLKMLNGLIKPDKGKITMRGRVGALIELGAGFNPILTGRENIYVNGSILGLTKKEIDSKLYEIIQFSELEDFIDTPVQNYSSGMKVRLGFAVAAQMEPDILLIDEVLAVGDLSFKVKCINTIGDMLKNAAVIFISHSMPSVSRISNKIMLINKGKNEFYGEDVKEGINNYLKRTTKIEKNVTGNSAVSISKYRVFNKNIHQKNDLLQLNHGDDIFIEFDVKINKKIAPPLIKTIIFNQNLQPVGDCFTKFCGMTLPPHNQRIKLKIKNIQLNSGLYTISIVILDSDTNNILCRIDGALHFQVKHSYNSWSSHILRGNWESVPLTENKIES